MSIKARLVSDMKLAMKARDSRRLGCIRMLKSRVQEREVARRGREDADEEITDDEVIEVITTYAKQRRDSIEAYRKVGRDELAAEEQAELEIITTYLPQQLDDAELLEIIKQAVAESGATSARDTGAVMKLVMPSIKGRADGKRVNALLRPLLS